MVYIGQLWFAIFPWLTPLLSAFATNLSGTISSNQTLTKANSTYVVTGNVLVNSAVTLTLEPGVEVRFSGNFGFHVNETLIAVGTPSDSIMFTSNQPVPQPGAWNSIQFSSSAMGAEFDGNGGYVAGSILRYCRLSFGGSFNGTLHFNGKAPYGCS